MRFDDLISQESSSQSLLSYDSYIKLAQVHGPSFFVLDERRLRINFRSLLGNFRANFHKVEIGYSYKTNYTPKVCSILHEEGAWAEVVSEMEFVSARRLVQSNHKIIFNGPYKSNWAFRQAALCGATINLDSDRDLELLSEVASSIGEKVTIRVVIRVNFALDETISRFGFDVNGPDFPRAIELLTKFPNVDFVGLHCHFPHRSLDSFRERAKALVALCQRVFPEKPPEVLNIGGGFFSSLPESIISRMSTSPATFSEYAKTVGQVLTHAFPDPAKSPTLFLEPGTALVADTMTFYTQVVSIKEVRGSHFATVAGSIFDISPNAKTKHLPVTPILNPQQSRNSSLPFAIAGLLVLKVTF